MIQYDQDEFFRLLWRLHGSAFRGHGPRRAMFMACMAAGVAVLNHIYVIVFIQTKTSIACGYTLSVFNVFMGLLISFRLNSAFNQWRAGVVAMGSVGDAARNIVSSTISYLDFGVDGEEKLRFVTELRRLVCLYVSILVQDARGCATDGIQSFIDGNLLADSEAEEMKRCGVVSEAPTSAPKSHGRVTVAQSNPTKLRASIVELWIRRIIQIGHRRTWFGMPQSATLNGSVSSLVTLYSTIYNIANIPIPFNYAHFLVLVMGIYLTVYTFAIVQTSHYFTPVWVFGWGFVIFSADDLAREIECPFGLDANDIDLEIRIGRIEEELNVILRCAYYHEAAIRAHMMASPATTVDSGRDVYMDKLPLSEASDHGGHEELPMPVVPKLRLMLTQSISEKDMAGSGSVEIDVDEADEARDEMVPLMPVSEKGANGAAYGSMSSVKDPVWL
ncbi:Aste57867_8845 [Aphanomyces stellatus]|uniref:Aste57867_8845 protein n=1 Tax=Aphanomyces stellatus TaxID=120398 RepID=A0A485KLF7_9STRA|nr:hypothetical protein As57867_008810 [Aphanomyces stellatus]VFT85731.1 Aste57867_8845 [Aphanomyces stellatus]